MPVNSHVSSDLGYDHASTPMQSRSPNISNLTRGPSFHMHKKHPRISFQDYSSYLTPYLETVELDNDKAFPLTGTGKSSVQSFSKEFFYKLLGSLKFFAPSYTHVPHSILKKSKSLLHKYQHVSHLPDSPLSTIKGFSNKIPPGDSPLVYHVPYRKSPAELAAIKTEIERMIKLKLLALAILCGGGGGSLYFGAQAS